MLVRSPAVSSLRVFGEAPKFFAQSFLNVGAVLQLYRVVVGVGMIAVGLRAHRLCNLERREGIDTHEEDEVGAVARPAEHVLVEQIVGSEEYERSFEEDQRRVLGRDYDS